MAKLSHISEGIIVEAGLSRILSHSPFAILTAFRADYTLKQNRQRNKRLESRFREVGVGGIKLIGHWLEAPDGEWYGHNLSEIDPELLQDVVEESYFVPLPRGMGYDQFQQWVVDRIIEFNQDAAVISDGKGVYLIDKAGDLTHIGNDISVGKISQAYSSIKGKTFVFEGTIAPSSNAHRLLLQQRGLRWIQP